MRVMLGQSQALDLARTQLRCYAACSAPVLIEGETGTGKELAAREIHYASARHAWPFVPVNCGALPDSLVENELFGHSRGAFTDARQAQPGLVDHARGGTLFLDEVDALSAKAQITLLRFLQDNEYRPVGCGTTRTAVRSPRTRHPTVRAGTCWIVDTNTRDSTRQASRRKQAAGGKGTHTSIASASRRIEPGRAQAGHGQAETRTAKK